MYFCYNISNTRVPIEIIIATLHEDVATARNREQERKKERQFSHVQRIKTSFDGRPNRTAPQSRRVLRSLARSTISTSEAPRDNDNGVGSPPVHSCRTFSWRFLLRLPLFLSSLARLPCESCSEPPPPLLELVVGAITLRSNGIKRAAAFRPDRV